jgi:hypothetical protein
VELRTGKQFSALKGAVQVARNHDLLISYSKEYPRAAAFIGYALLGAQEHDVVKETLSRARSRASRFFFWLDRYQ